MDSAVLCLLLLSGLLPMSLAKWPPAQYWRVACISGTPNSTRWHARVSFNIGHPFDEPEVHAARLTSGSAAPCRTIQVQQFFTNGRSEDNQLFIVPEYGAKQKLSRFWRDYDFKGLLYFPLLDELFVMLGITDVLGVLGSFAHAMMRVTLTGTSYSDRRYFVTLHCLLKSSMCKWIVWKESFGSSSGIFLAVSNTFLHRPELEDVDSAWWLFLEEHTDFRAECIDDSDWWFSQYGSWNANAAWIGVRYSSRVALRHVRVRQHEHHVCPQISVQSSRDGEQWFEEPGNFYDTKCDGPSDAGLDIKVFPGSCVDKLCPLLCGELPFSRQIFTSPKPVALDTILIACMVLIVFASACMLWYYESCTWHLFIDGSSRGDLPFERLCTAGAVESVRHIYQTFEPDINRLTSSVHKIFKLTLVRHPAWMLRKDKSLSTLIGRLCPELEVLPEHEAVIQFPDGVFHRYPRLETSEAVVRVPRGMLKEEMGRIVQAMFMRRSIECSRSLAVLPHAPSVQLNAYASKTFLHFHSSIGCGRRRWRSCPPNTSTSTEQPGAGLRAQPAEESATLGNQSDVEEDEMVSSSAHPRDQNPSVLSNSSTENASTFCPVGPAANSTSPIEIFDPIIVARTPVEIDHLNCQAKALLQRARRDGRSVRQLAEAAQEWTEDEVRQAEQLEARSSPGPFAS